MKIPVPVAITAALALAGLCSAGHLLTSATSDITAGSSSRWSTRVDTKPVLTMDEVSFGGVNIIGRDSLGNPLLVAPNTIDLSADPNIDAPRPAAGAGYLIVHTTPSHFPPDTGFLPANLELLIGSSLLGNLRR